MKIKLNTCKRVVKKLTIMLYTIYKAILFNARHCFKRSVYVITQLRYKLRKDKDRRILKKLPWYLILGSEKSGKKNFISNLNLHFAHAKHFGVEAEKYQKQFCDYDWWFSEQAVFIDAMSCVKENDTLYWKQFINLLKRERKNKPINGIILTFAVPDILIYSNQQRQLFIQDICLYIRAIHKKFKSQVPVYLILTKFDLIEGFLDFFSSLSKEQLNQVCGVTFPLELCGEVNSILQFFHKEFHRIIVKLNEQVIWLLDGERDQRSRERIFNFPKQLYLLDHPIAVFIAELFGAIRYPNTIHLRGIYFCSSKQEGKAYDFVLQAISKKFQLIPSVMHRSQEMHEKFFMQNLFHEVIYPEAKILGESEYGRKIKKRIHTTWRILIPIMCLVIIFILHVNYRDSLRNIKETESAITMFKTLQYSFNFNSGSVVATLPLLQQLHATQLAYDANLSYIDTFLFMTGMLKNDMSYAMQRELSNIFIPQIAARLQDNLKHTISNHTILYSTLKGYLAFSPDTTVNRTAIKAPIEYDWNLQYQKNPDSIKQLILFLDLSLKNSIAKLPVDSALINQIREQLEASSPSERAYGLLLLKAKLSDFPNLPIPSVVGTPFSMLFTTNRKNLEIPNLYTAIGFKKIFLPEYKHIANEVLSDDRIMHITNEDDKLQTTTEIENTMQEEYQHLYEINWMSCLTAIHIKPFTNLQNAISTLQLIVSNHSPLIRLLRVIYDNTDSVKSNKIAVAKFFEKVNQYQPEQTKTSWYKTQKILQNLRNYFLQLKQSSDVNQAEYNAVVTAITSGKSPIIDLTTIANNAPNPLKHWLNDIANASWKILLTGAHKYINDVWQTTVLQFYDANINGRYPIDPNSDSNITITDFNYFFSPTGILNHFFSTYLKIFIQTDNSPWTLKTVDGHNMQLLHNDLLLFQTLKKIVDNYFPNNSQTANLLFSIKPLTLAADASNVIFVIGNSRMHYSHGPEISTVIAWPLQQDTDNVQLILSTFSGAQFAKVTTGPWAIFKLLNESHLKEKSVGQYSFGFTLGGHYVSYELQGSATRSLYLLSDLKNFKLPKDLFNEKNKI